MPALMSALSQAQNLAIYPDGMVTTHLCPQQQRLLWSPGRL
jgi:hypothetical protein